MQVLSTKQQTAVPRGIPGFDYRLHGAQPRNPWMLLSGQKEDSWLIAQASDEALRSRRISQYGLIPKVFMFP